MAGAPAEEKVAKTGGTKTEEEKLALVAYLLGGLTGILVFLIGKGKLSKFHGIQSLLLSLVAFVINWVLSFALGAFWGMSWSNPAAWGTYTSMWSLMNLIWVAIYLYGLYIGFTKAYKGEMYKVPYLGDFAEDFAK